MNKCRGRSIVLLASLWIGLLFTVLAPTNAAIAAGERGPARPASVLAASVDSGRVIVKFKPDVVVRAAQVSRSAGPQRAKDLGARLRLSLTDGAILGARTQVIGGAATGLGASALAARLASQSDVEWAVPDRRRRALAAPDDPLYPDGQTLTPTVGQWYLRAPTESVVSAINAEAAWDLSSGSSSVVVAVLDTGIRPEHPDLADKLLPGYDFISDAVAANDGNGRDADPTDPGDWVTSAENARGEFAGCGVSDSSWHGSQTSGLIGAATQNGLGMASVGRNVLILPVRVLGKCGGVDSDIVPAMLWAAGIHVDGVPDNPHPAQILNLSFGAVGACSSLYADTIATLNAAGVVVVVAAGNEGDAVDEPANCPGAIAVAGVRHTGTKVGYSNLGPEVGLSAPAGNCVNLNGTCLYPLLSTSNSGTQGPGASIYTGGGANATLGTSFSAPMVAGTVALMRSANPTLTPMQVLQLLQASARPFPTTGGDAGVGTCQAPGGGVQNTECYCTTSTCGAGLLDARAAVTAAASAAGVVANIQSTAFSDTAPALLTLDAGSSSAIDGRSITGYQWTLAAGGDLAAFTTATNGPSVSLLPSGTGDVTVQLVVTDSTGAQATTTQRVPVVAVVVTGGGEGGGGAPSGGGGGGGVGPAWLLGLAGLIAALAADRPRNRPRGRH